MQWKLKRDANYLSDIANFFFLFQNLKINKADSHYSARSRYHLSPLRSHKTVLSSYHMLQQNYPRD